VGELIAVQNSNWPGGKENKPRGSTEHSETGEKFNFQAGHEKLGEATIWKSHAPKGGTHKKTMTNQNGRRMTTKTKVVVYREGLNGKDGGLTSPKEDQPKSIKAREKGRGDKSKKKNGPGKTRDVKRGGQRPSHRAGRGNRSAPNGSGVQTKFLNGGEGTTVKF